MLKQIDYSYIINNIEDFSNYWELYSFAKKVFVKPEDFNLNMALLRKEFLKKLPIVKV